MQDKILMTGASGFVGKAVLAKLNSSSVVLLGRSKPLANTNPFFKMELAPETNYASALISVNVVIHCAARVHLMKNDSTDQLKYYRKVNTDGTLNLANQAAKAGVSRFIFLSSIKVNGESTDEGNIFESDSVINPQDAYGISKAEAEAGLRKISEETGMDVVIIRPPLVYGKGVKANFAALMNLSKKNLPLPFGAIRNKRSLVSIDNLVDLIVTCIDHPEAANKTFLVSDGQDISTAELLQSMVRAMGGKPRLLPIPLSFLKLAGKVIGKEAMINRLCGNLQVDIDYTKETLAWTPPVSFDEGIRRCFDEEGI